MENPGFIGWVADAELVVRVRHRARSPTAALVIMIRDDAGQDWRPLLTIAAGGRADQRAGRVQRGRPARCWR